METRWSRVSAGVLGARESDRGDFEAFVFDFVSFWEGNTHFLPRPPLPMANFPSSFALMEFSSATLPFLPAAALTKAAIVSLRLSWGQTRFNITQRRKSAPVFSPFVPFLSVDYSIAQSPLALLYTCLPCLADVRHHICVPQGLRLPSPRPPLPLLLARPPRRVLTVAASPCFSLCSIPSCVSADFHTGTDRSP